ncbi:putative SMC protein [Vibrio crassostreae]|uniref:AAA family ATPase n=1 Tax=Vibrio sp. Isolate34 TaxID=2908540 RepID=UPI001EFE62D9|nr:AAA family ATPase [Vibrio sp. Isolate34]CAK2038929.1 putative SMC protein [Vibrio crassostreae]CAK2041988.1 putative SMC protein [Vibrio crassostreae]CAK2055232.1 putative SMC protein [Vibrio crassostreae]CAK2331545.1 putative SMC protein [Vibrio crassostreae]
MFISSAEILNLWGKEKITIPFYEDVTLLTGSNGSGKSSLLNILFDSLNSATKNRKPSTSKNRFWSSKISFSNNVDMTTLLIPASVDDKEFDNTTMERLESVENTHDYEFLCTLQDHFTLHSNGFSTNYVSYTNNEKGERWLKTVDIPEEVNEDGLHDTLTKAPLAFLFQEDRQSMHNLDNASVEFVGNYWKLYKSSIDERFSYCRDFMQVLESHLDKLVAKELRSSGNNLANLLLSEEYNYASKRSQEIESIVEILNSYFEDSEKYLVRDEQNKYTLADANSGDPIHWSLLSRGEKTIIYLLFSTYYYRDRVKVFLLDEPEISLHVRWQKRLIKDLRDIAPDSQLIIATHSPSLVKDGWRSRCIEVGIK